MPLKYLWSPKCGRSLKKRAEKVHAHMVWSRPMPIISSIHNVTILHRMKKYTMWELNCYVGSSRTDVAITFYCWMAWSAGGITQFTKVSEPADPNRNLSSSKWASFPFAQFFLSSTWAGPVRSITCRVNCSEHMYIQAFVFLDFLLHQRMKNNAYLSG